MAQKYNVGDSVILDGELYTVKEIYKERNIYRLEDAKGTEAAAHENHIAAATYAVLTHVDTRRPLVVPTYHAEFPNIVKSPNYQLHGVMDIHAAVDMQLNLFLSAVEV